MTKRLLFSIFSIIIAAMIISTIYSYPTSIDSSYANNPLQVIVTTKTTLLNGTDYYRLNLNAKIPNGYHIYSINYLDGKAPATVIKLDSNPSIVFESEWAETPNNAKLSSTSNWSIHFRLTDLEKPPTVHGVITVYPCSETNCLMPQKIVF